MGLGEIIALIVVLFVVGIVYVIYRALSNCAGGKGGLLCKTFHAVV